MSGTPLVLEIPFRFRFAHVHLSHLRRHPHVYTCIDDAHAHVHALDVACTIPGACMYPYTQYAHVLCVCARPAHAHAHAHAQCTHAQCTCTCICTCGHMHTGHCRDAHIPLPWTSDTLRNAAEQFLAASCPGPFYGNSYSTFSKGVALMRNAALAAAAKRQMMPHARGPPAAAPGPANLGSSPLYGLAVAASITAVQQQRLLTPLPTLVHPSPHAAAPPAPPPTPPQRTLESLAYDCALANYQVPNSAMHPGDLEYGWTARRSIVSSHPGFALLPNVDPSRC